MKSNFPSPKEPIVLINNKEWHEYKWVNRFFLCLDALIYSQRDEKQCLFVPKIKRGYDFASTDEYIHVSGAKSELHNLPPCVTKLKDLKDNRENPSGDASAQLTRASVLAKLIPCWVQTRQKERGWKFRVKYFIASMCAAICVWSAVIITTIWGLVQHCPLHKKNCWGCVHAVTDLKRGWAALEVWAFCWLCNAQLMDSLVVVKQSSIGTNTHTHTHTYNKDHHTTTYRHTQVSSDYFRLFSGL